jgi:hypothetical protein
VQWQALCACVKEGKHTISTMSPTGCMAPIPVSPQARTFTTCTQGTWLHVTTSLFSIAHNSSALTSNTRLDPTMADLDKAKMDKNSYSFKICRARRRIPRSPPGFRLRIFGKCQWLFPSCNFFFLCQVVALALPTYYVFMPKSGGSDLNCDFLSPTAQLHC